MNAWKRNMYVLWVGNFFCSAGFSMIVPFLPLYVQELGIHDEKMAALWSAFIFGINHVMVALVSPFWGKLSDKYGQKMMMVRSGIGLSIIIVCMGLVHTPVQLLLLRALFGTMLAAPYLGKLGDRYGPFIVLLSCLLLISLLYIPQARITNPWVLMATRFSSGLCVGGLIPSISSLLRRLTPTAIQGSVFSYNASANSLGNVSGALFGGVMASHFGIPVVFYIIAGVFFVHFLMLVPQYRTMAQAANRRDGAAM